MVQERELVMGLRRWLGSLKPLADDGQFDPEQGQAVVRILVVAIGGIYSTCAALAASDSGTIDKMVLLYSLYLPFSVAFWWWVRRHPGGSSTRKMFSIVFDMPAVTFGLAAGGEPATPLFAILLWVTVGNGLRFGPRYLVAATAMALCSIAVTTAFNPFWRANPFMVTALVVTAIVVPAYILMLLSRLRRAYAAEQEANLSKSRFLAQASHDLRQPIHAISLFTACLRDAGLAPRELQMVDNIDRSLESLSRLFKSLLDVSTLDSGKLVPSMETVAIADIVDDVVRQNLAAAERNGCELRVVTCSEKVETDRALLTTMLQNIVNNAIKYAPGRAIAIGCRRESGTLAVKVLDQGPGITEEHLAKVFEEFYQVRSRGDRDVEGVGLGLPIVQRMAKLMRLEVRMRSVPGRGTSVAIAGIPVAAPLASPILASMPASRPSVSVDGLRVVLVEDDEAVLIATASLLRRWGCIVETHRKIPVAIDACDVVITDFDLGEGETGTDCIAKVRRLAGWHVPAVVMSGHDAGRVREDLDDEAVPILSKPVRPVELRSVVTVVAMDASDRH